MSINRNRQTDAGEPKESGFVYQMITKRILQEMMKGQIPWRKTWTARGGRHPFTNYVTGKPYSFLNTMLLGEPGEYLTMNQIKDRGGHLRKGSKGRFVIYWGEYVPKSRKKEEKRLLEEGKDTSHLKVRFPKYYYVYNAKDTEGLKPRSDAPAPMVAAEDPTDIADMIVRGYVADTGVNLRGDQSGEPAYDPATDTVAMPPKEEFTYEEDFYASLLQQLVHSTATDDRCNRKKDYGKMLSDEMTVREELTAEIGSSMVLSVAGMNRRETHEQIAAECQRWIDAFNNDCRLIVNASSGAEKAAKYILGKFAA